MFISVLKRPNDKSRGVFLMSMIRNLFQIVFLFIFSISLNADETQKQPLSEIIEELESKITKQIDPRLFEAARTNDTGTIMGLVVEGIDIHMRDADGMTAAHHAAKHGNLEALEYLVMELGISLLARDGKGRTVLGIARTTLPTDEVLRLRQNYHKVLPLFEASQTNDVKSLKIAEVEGVVDMYMLDTEGMNAAHHAARRGNLEALEYLIMELGISLLARDGKGRTVLDYARLTLPAYELHRLIRSEKTTCYG